MKRYRRSVDFYIFLLAIFGDMLMCLILTTCFVSGFSSSSM